MKVFFYAVLFIVAGAYAMPPQEIETQNERIVTNQIRRAIEQIRQQIRQAGLDPLQIDNAKFEYKPMPFVAEFEAFIEDLTFTGASNIAIHNLRLNILTSRVIFDISLPQLRLTVGDSGFDIVVFGNSDTGRFNGSLSVSRIRLNGEVRYRLGLISGISIRGVTIRFSVGAIESNVRLIAFGEDYTDTVNDFINDIPATLKQYENEINRALEQFIMGILRDILLNQFYNWI